MKVRCLMACSRGGARALRLLFIVSVALAVAAIPPDPPAAGAPPAAPRTKTAAVDVLFAQLNWMEDDEMVRFAFSRVGVATFLFSPEATQLLSSHGGGYINVVVELPGVFGPQWSVRNLFASYPTEEYMLNARPSVQFELPVPDEFRVTDLLYRVKITSQPLKRRPHAEKRVAIVDLQNYLVGGRKDGGSSDSNIPFIIGPWIGFVGGSSAHGPRPAGVAGPPQLLCQTAVAPGNLPGVDEPVSGCAPGATSRSLQYMLDEAGIPTPPAQEVFSTLCATMGTVTTPTGGTNDPNLLAGKQQYTGANNLPIQSQLSYGTPNINAAVNAASAAVNNGGDAELLITWFRPPPAPPGTPGGGHVAMVTSMQRFPNGQIQITYVDDASQGNGDPRNTVHTIMVNPNNGNFPGGRVDGFMVESMTPMARPRPLFSFGTSS